LLQAQGIAAQQDAKRGFDHGVFIPLKLIFPQADIPVGEKVFSDRVMQTTLSASKLATFTKP